MLGRARPGCSVPPDSILFQACHGSKHGWITLAQICDFARLIADRRAGQLANPGYDEARRARSLRMLLLGCTWRIRCRSVNYRQNCSKLRAAMLISSR